MGVERYGGPSAIGIRARPVRGPSDGARAILGTWGPERSGSKRWSTMAEVAMTEGLTVTENCSVIGIIDQAGAGRG